jgi:hypothetical protein
LRPRALIPSRLHPPPRERPRSRGSTALARGKAYEHIYLKIDACSRAAASLFGTEHGLLTEDELTATVAA